MLNLPGLIVKTDINEKGLNNHKFDTRLNEPVSSKMYTLACAPIEDSDQTAHQRSLI